MSGNPKLKECPVCGNTEVHQKTSGIGDGNDNIWAICLECNVEGPWPDADASKWNSIPRRSEVGELLRMVDKFAEYHEHENLVMSNSYQQMMIYANRLRKEWKL